MGCNGSGKSDGSAREEVITYKRRRRGDGCDLAPDKLCLNPFLQQAMKDPHENGDTMYEQDHLSRIAHHRKIVLEHLLQLPDVSGGSGIHTCIQDALMMDPFDSTQKCEMAHVINNTFPEGHQCRGFEVDPHSKGPDYTRKTSSVGSESGVSVGVDKSSNTRKCQNVFLDILNSQEFALLCDLVYENFHQGVAKNMSNFSMVNAKMKDGVYEPSSRSFGEDIVQIWENFQKVGQKMVVLAGNLISISQSSYKKQVGDKLVREDDELKCEGSGQLAGEEKISVDSYTTSQLPSCESDRSNRLAQTEGSCLYKVCNCSRCGEEADGENSLICDGCEAMYHVRCLEHTVAKIPTQSWYCISCSTKKKNLPKSLSCNNAQEDCLHQSCVVCERLEISVSKNLNHANENGKELVVANDPESSVSSMESEGPLQPSRTALYHLCKLCGTCEDKDKRFLVCGNSLCLYRFYHIRCLKSSLVTSWEQGKQNCWYCPSCLCRDCLVDKDDDKIVMCDGCDEAYHIYCMNPPLTSIPEGKWFCAPCNIQRAKQAMRLYEEWVLRQHGSKDAKQAKGTKRSADTLCIAAEKLKH